MKKGFLLSSFLLTVTVLTGLFLSSTHPVKPGQYPVENAEFYASEAYLHNLRANQNTGEVDPMDVRIARQTVANMLTSRDANSLNWVSLGPDNFGGKTSALLYDNRDGSANTIYAASMGGGIWRSVNNGITWEGVSNLSIQGSSMVQTPDGTIYVGTGDGKSAFTSNYNLLGVLNFGTSFMGTGIYKSSDGDNFSLLAATSPEYNDNAADWAFVYSLAANQSNDVYAGTNTGLKYSTDGGSSWTMATDIDGNELDERTTSVKIGSDGTIIAGVSNKVYISKSGAADGFVDRSTADSVSLPTQNVFMVEVAIAPSDPNIMYALLINQGGAHVGVFRSTDKGDTWYSILPTTAAYNILQSRGGSNSYITVFPQNPDRILVGGINIWQGRKFNEEGFFAWDAKSRSATTQFDPRFLPAGQQTIAFRNGTNNQFIVGTDGGVFKGETSGEVLSYTTSNRNYITTQFYSVYPSGGENRVLGGAQNNGIIYISGEGNTVRYGQELWFQGGSFVNGHGTNTLFSTINSEAIVMSSISGQIFRSEDLAFTTSAQFLKDTNYMSTTADVLAASNTFKIPMALWESYENQNSRDSVTFHALKDYPAGSILKVRSKNNDHPFYYTLPSNVSLSSGDSIRVKDIVSSKLFLAAQNRLWMTTELLDFAKRPDWFVLTNNTTGFSGMPQSMAISSDADHAFVGMQNGRFYRVSNIATAYDFSTAQLNGSNYQITTTEIPIYLPGTEDQITRAITSVAVDPNNANNVVVTFANYGNEHYVFMSNNALSDEPTFVSKQGNLPAMPVYSSLFEMSNPGMVFLGTDLGVFITDNINSSSPTWNPDADILGNLPVFDLKQQLINKSPDTVQLINIDTLILNYPGTRNLGIIYAATYGKGIFRANDFRKPVGLDENHYATANKQLMIRVFPNPVIEHAVIELDLKEQSPVNYQIFDLSGRMIDSRQIGQMNAGRQSIGINSRHLNTGTYIIRIQAGSHIGTSKFVVY